MNRRVGHWMTRSVLHAEPSAPLFRGLEMMADRGIRHLLVMENEELVGIVSNRDVVRSAGRNGDHRLELHDCTLGEVMTKMPLYTVAATASLGEAAELMHTNKVSALPVLSEGKVSGLITSDDVLAAVALGEHMCQRPDI